jgi:hypothetical protein
LVGAAAAVFATGGSLLAAAVVRGKVFDITFDDTSVFTRTFNLIN